MQLPGSQEIITAMLRAASGSGISDESLRCAVTFECSVYANGAGAPSRKQVEEFQHEVVRAQHHLIDRGLIVRPEDNMVATTPLGEAYLAAGLATLESNKQAKPAGLSAIGEAKPGPSRTLTELLDLSELEYEPLSGNGCYSVASKGELRSWKVLVWESNGWLCMRTYVMRIPGSTLVRSSVHEAALQINEELSAAKLSVGREGALYIDGEYSFEDIDAVTLRHLIGHIAAAGDMVYPRLLKAELSAETLASLEVAFKRDGGDAS